MDNLIDRLHESVSRSQFLNAEEMFAYLHHLKDRAADEIDRLNRELAEARDKALEEAATMAYVECIKHCSARDGMTLIGHPVGHSVAAAIRALKEKP